MAENQHGIVAQVMGPVLDIRFEEGELPPINRALTVPVGDRTLTVEVAQHIGDNTVRCVAMASTDGLQRGTPVTDTIKFADGDNVITGTPDRSTLRAVQTPQVFEKELFTIALSDAEDLASVTDDCSLIEQMGGEVLIVEGSRENIKLTTPIDAVLAESILRGREEV